MNRDIETIQPQELQKIQNEKFLKQLDYVWSNSPFYQEKFRSCGLQKDDIKSLNDLPKLPFTEKDDLRKSQEEHPPLGNHLAAPMDSLIRIHSSSGTTGMPTFVGITRHDQSVWNEIVARSFFTQGLRETDIVIHAVGLTFFVGGLPVKDAMEYIGATFVPIGTGASDRIVNTTKRLGANVLHCTPSYGLYLSEYLRQREMDPRELSFKKITVGAEPGGSVPSIRKKIEGDFGAIVTEGLGNSDAAPVIFSECPYQQGMHFCAQEYIVCELIHPDTGDVIEMEDDAEGELVYTLIDREACPVMRFRTHDRVQVWTSPCECGRTSFRLRCLGRTDDMLIVLGVNVFPAAVKDVVASFTPHTTGEMVILLEEPGPAVQPPVRIQVEHGDTGEDLGKLKQQIEAALREKLVFRANVQMVPSGTLPRYEMKSKLVRKLYEEE
ncbi:MAG: phenylacetate--CoA ligase family protein [Dehalococcoidia bacterium]